MHKQKILTGLIAASLFGMASNSFAAAFQLSEKTSSGLGRAYSGEAVIADNAGVVATNPALMTSFKRPEFSIGAIYIRPDVNLEGTFYAPNMETGNPKDKHDASAKKVAKSKLIPNFYMVYPVNDKWAIGGGVNANFGLVVEYDPKYSAGLMGGLTDLATINSNLSAAYKFNENFSFGLGINAVYAKAKLERYVGKLTPSNPSKIFAHLDGKTWGYGWNVGAHYKFNEDHQLGLAYHSQVQLKFKGYYFDELPPGLSKGTQDAKLNVDLPAYWELSGYHKVAPKLALHYSYMLTQWKSFQAIHATGNGGKVLMDKPENFKNSYRIGVGATYDVNDKLALRVGFAYDKTPGQKGSFSISIPDQSRYWYSLGATYKFTSDLSVDTGIAYIKAKKGQFTEVEKENVIHGDFRTKSSVTLFGLNLNYRF